MNVFGNRFSDNDHRHGFGLPYRNRARPDKNGPEQFSARGAPDGVCVFRASHPKEGETYVIGLRDPLPVISIPLRPTDPDIPLELQPLIDRCHQRGRYYRLRYQAELTPPLCPSDRDWVQATLRQQELI